MKGLFEVYDDKSVIQQKLIEAPQLCMLLNRNLPLKGIYDLEQEFYVVEVEHEGEMLTANICGFYKKPRSKFKDNPLVKAHDEKITLLEEIIDKPFSILLGVRIPVDTMIFIEEIWDVVQIRHKGKKRKVIPCAYYSHPHLKIRKE